MLVLLHHSCVYLFTHTLDIYRVVVCDGDLGTVFKTKTSFALIIERIK